jgi:hypothetical protein
MKSGSLRRAINNEQLAMNNGQAAICQLLITRLQGEDHTQSAKSLSEESVD